MMADDQAPDAAEIRRTLKAHGVDVPDKGKLSDAHKATYREIIDGGSYDGGVTQSDFDRDDATLPGMEDIQVPAGVLGGGGAYDDGGQADELAAERTPRGPASASGASPFARWRRDGGGGRGGGKRPRRRPKAKKASEWVPTGRMLERFWGEAAWSMRKMPPMQRIMAAQAPMVGVTLQDAARDTFVDRMLLQRMARGEDRIEAVNAVFGPLFWTGMIMRFGGTELTHAINPETGQPVMGPAGPVVVPLRDEEGNPVWNDQTKVMIGGLRLGLMSWLRVGERRAEEIIARAEELDELGDQADALIKFILSAPKPGQSFKDMQAEARAAAGFYNGGAPAPAEGGASTASEPAPAAAAVAVMTRGEHPYPPTPEPRTLQFLPPDPRVASQVVPHAPMPQA